MPRRKKSNIYTPESVEASHAAAIEDNGGPVIPAENPPTTLYTGEKGSGKSISAVSHVAQVYAMGVPLFHNGAVNFGRELDMAVFRDNGYSNCVVLFDELEEYLNNLRTGATVQVDTIGVMIQMRHQGVEIVATTQFPNEINGRFLRRVDHQVLCQTTTAGKSVHHIRIGAPWNRDSMIHQRSSRAVLKNAWRFMNLYDHKRYVAVGSARQTASELRAIAQLTQTKAIWGYVISCALTGTNAVRPGTVQYYLSSLEPAINVTTTKIGMALREFQLYGFALSVNSRHGQSREWLIPDGLADAYAADQPEEAGRIRAGAGV
ncbi:MAG: ATP-binding protein [Chloroflexi bacterium]|nr:ATP-binding protein [Chloroflexota bacterium]